MAYANAHCTLDSVLLISLEMRKKNQYMSRVIQTGTYMLPYSDKLRTSIERILTASYYCRGALLFDLVNTTRAHLYRLVSKNVYCLR